MYTPPFKITSKILNLVAEISAKIERYAILLEQDTELRLRKANRIKTIHSSLAIEGNELTEECRCTSARDPGSEERNRDLRSFSHLKPL